jgi:hypothetical protein
LLLKALSKGGDEDIVEIYVDDDNFMRLLAKALPVSVIILTEKNSNVNGEIIMQKQKQISLDHPKIRLLLH